MTRNRGGWRPATLKYLETVRAALSDLREFWPLTVRQIYYQLVAAEVIPNKRREYKKLSELLKKARLKGEIGWETIEDRARQHLASGGWPHAGAFVRAEREGFLAGYRRDRLQAQPWAFEIWIEKDALSRICHEVAVDYCIPVIVARGFSSVSYVHECRLRAELALARGQDGLRILYFGDLDPSGWSMLPAMLKTLRVDMELGEAVEGVRCALTPEQVADFDLPRSVDAMKKKDPRTPKYRAWLREQGHRDDLAVELDALRAADLQRLVRDAIEANLDLSRFRREQEIEATELLRLHDLRQRVLSHLDGGEAW